jgi:tRNA(Ile)-lysidine synthase
MALLHALAACRDKYGYSLLAISVDHGLRPEASAEVALVGEQAARLGVDFEPVGLQVGAGANLQERARTARYAALWEVVQRRLGSGGLLATAHHADDRAETVLLRLLRGTSLSGLGVLKPREGRLIRPAIGSDRRSVLEHVARHGVPFVDDPSNGDPRFLRVRVRHEVLPLLRELAPGIVAQLCDLADEASRGDPALGLNREQRSQLRRALQQSGPVDLRLPHGLRLRREPSDD